MAALLEPPPISTLWVTLATGVHRLADASIQYLAAATRRPAEELWSDLGPQPPADAAEQAL